MWWALAWGVLHAHGTASLESEWEFRSNLTIEITERWKQRRGVGGLASLKVQDGLKAPGYPRACPAARVACPVCLWRQGHAHYPGIEWVESGA